MLADIFVDVLVLQAILMDQFCSSRPMDAPQKPIETDFASVAAEYSSWTESSTGGA